MQIMLSWICCLTFVLFTSLDEHAAEEDIKFKVFWNVPSQQCSRKYGINVTDSLRKFGVLVNTGEEFKGDSITIFYSNDLGLYPRIKEGTHVNGGHPQLADLSKHLEKTKNDIERLIPNKDFEGLAVIDWEEWRPVWEFNWSGFRQYQEISRELVKAQHPNWSAEEVNKKAAAEWEEAANFIRLRWLWESSSAICPSLYLRSSQLDSYNFTQRIWLTHGRLAEALRVRNSDVPVYPYINYFLYGSHSPVPEVS
ncbi:hyaluronidase 1-like [Limulus polyphemus]|uniref:Hyaluronidase n=1 Tax=Limulus polyphemus TaxID=6850 RepID=A0ABM1SAW1_LIMPO|nr:hyaluronidase 1-like [Limulus polyphemus]